jgi:hypothetical protein
MPTQLQDAITQGKTENIPRLPYADEGVQRALWVYVQLLAWFGLEHAA